MDWDLGGFWDGISSFFGGGSTLDPNSLDLGSAAPFGYSPTPSPDISLGTGDLSMPDLGSSSASGIGDILTKGGSDKGLPWGDILGHVAGPTISAIGGAYLANNNPNDKLAEQKLAQDQMQFEAQLAFEREKLALAAKQGGGAASAKMAELALQKKIARAKMIENAYAGLAANSLQGGANNAAALQRIVDNIHFGASGRS